MADTKCAGLIACAKACPDEDCADKCGEGFSQDDQATFALVLGLSACGAEKDCVSVCGNGKCQAGENKDNCADDCAPKGPTCGDGKCETGETNASCAADCKATGPVCGDGTCDEGETTDTCAADCKSTGTAVCGNGTCESGESAANCLFDCDAVTKAEMACAKEKCASQWAACSTDEKCFAALMCTAACNDAEACVQACLTTAGDVALSKVTTLQGCALEVCSGATGPVCGNGTCESGETNSTCPSDCQAAGAVCGNAKCEQGESTSTCPADCKAAGPVCGNKTCESGESYGNCPTDCPCTSDAQCGAGKSCVAGACQTQSTAVCGDMTCASGENCTMDCDAAAKAAVFCAMEACADWTKCKSNSGCWAAFVCANQCGSDQTCIQGCAAKAGTGLSTLIALAECTQKSCSGGGAVCGNGTCESGETTSSCPVDCKTTSGCTSNSQCPSGQTCVSGTCKAATSSCSPACPSGASCYSGICSKMTTGSCVGACDQQSPDGCYCDAACEEPANLDCCPDKALVCTP